MAGEEKRKAFKDYFDRSAARALATQLHGADPAFDKKAFVRRATDGLEPLAFAARVRRFSDALRATLPSNVPRALEVIVKSLPPPLPDCEAVTDGWLQWPVGQFIADHGLEHFESSMAAMVELTQRFSSEFAVRPFVEHRPQETFARLRALTDHPSPHVRRWCSEGVRPRLPWGKRLNALILDPAPIWPLLEALKDDEERYVGRSVANNLNDLAKDHPEAVVQRCQKWTRRAPEARQWVIKHALRSLIKSGHAGALAVMGVGPADKISATLRIKPKRIAIGDAVDLVIVLKSGAKKTQRLVVDYAVRYARAQGTSAPKVFKWTNLSLDGGQETTLRKRHSMRPTTIRRLYPGRHDVIVQINGQPVAEASFQLTA